MSDDALARALVVVFLALGYWCALLRSISLVATFLRRSSSFDCMRDSRSGADSCRMESGAYLRLRVRRYLSGLLDGLIECVWTLHHCPA